MFTGIVTHRGEVRSARRGTGVVELEVAAAPVAGSLRLGDSIAVNGVCLTATAVTADSFSAQVMDETVARTTLGHLSRGDVVNLELPARPVDRLGGHLVQGHVDGVAEVVRVERNGESARVWWRADRDLVRYVVPRGSVALDGVSLTVVEVDGTAFQVALVPHTLESTTLSGARPGTRANVEVDVVARYVERFVAETGVSGV
jgi:riboflavin synthase